MPIVLENKSYEKWSRALNLPLLILNGQGCRTGRDGRTHARTHKREWIYRFLMESKDIRGTKKTTTTTHKNSSYTKTQQYSFNHLEDIGSKVHFLAKKGFWGTKTTLGGQKNSLTHFFYWSSKWYGDLTSCKKISNGLGCRTGTHGRTSVRTDVRTGVNW